MKLNNLNKVVALMFFCVLLFVFAGCGGGGGGNGGGGIVTETTYKISGTVRATNTAKSPVVSVTIVAKIGDVIKASTNTNSNGRFTISGLASGLYSIVFFNAANTNPRLTGEQKTDVTIVNTDVADGVFDVDVVSLPVPEETLGVAIDIPTQGQSIASSPTMITAQKSGNATVVSTKYSVKKQDGSSVDLANLTEWNGSYSWDVSDTTDFPNGQYTVYVNATGSGGRTAQASVQFNLVIVDRFIAPRIDKARLTSQKIIPALQSPGSVPGVFVYIYSEETAPVKWFPEDIFCTIYDIDIVESTAIANYSWGETCPSFDCTKVHSVVRACFKDLNPSGNDPYVYDDSIAPAEIQSLDSVSVYPDLTYPAPDQLDLTPYQ